MAETAPLAARPEGPERTWRCFHCDEVFHSAELAAVHFGDDELAQPGCLLKVGDDFPLLRALRQAQRELGRFYCEDSAVDRWAAAVASTHAEQLRRAEEEGYGKAVRDMTAQLQAAHAALQGLEAANEALCRGRPQEVYYAMLRHGQADALTDLDAARLRARELLRGQGTPESFCGPPAIKTPEAS